MARRDRKSGGAAFQRGDALLQNCVGWVADAGIDVTECLQAEQRRGVVDVVEHERRGLVDRRRARPRGRIGLAARMDRERGKAGRAFGHGCSLRLRAKVMRTFIGAGSRAQGGTADGKAFWGALGCSCWAF